MFTKSTFFLKSPIFFVSFTIRVLFILNISLVDNVLNISTEKKKDEFPILLISLCRKSFLVLNLSSMLRSGWLKQYLS